MTLPMVATWGLVGLLVGFGAGFVMRAGGYGWRSDVLLALGGGALLSGIAWLLEIPPDPGMIPLTIVAVLGSAGLVVAQRKIWPFLVK
jgi:hypothetical protein